MAKRRNTKRTVKKQATVDSASKTFPVSVKSDVTAEVLSSVNQTVMLKVCRLCESKDGPFLDIFDAENVTAKKIYDIMPFSIIEDDELSHKICFRCSAKVEEFYEFIQKCVKTQESLRKAAGKKGVTIKTKGRSVWEDKLSQCNISNHDICDAYIKKAIESFKNVKPYKEEDSFAKEINTEHKIKHDNDGNMTNQTSKHRNFVEESSSKKNTEVDLSRQKSQVTNSGKHINKTNTFSVDVDSGNTSEETPKPFNIMDHVSMIKVNGVGILFQCKLCNRNFLKKEVVLNHGCAKNGGKKIAEEVKTIAPEPPKIPLIKYINTKLNDAKKQLEQQNENIKYVVNTSPINIDDDEEDNKPLKVKPKPRIGPASKVKRNENRSPVPQTSANEGAAQVAPPVLGTHIATTSVQTPFTIPDLNRRYKLVPGLNNTFMLVEDKLELPRIQDLLEKCSDLDRSKNTILPASKGKVAPIIPKPTSVEQPYPVGLIKSGVPHQSTSPTTHETKTAAMKKQSYTIVQTGNPSKLVISTKSPAVDEVPRKRSKKVTSEDVPKPYNVTIEDATRSSSGFFTLVNVDPLLEPSYVLPTEHIIQESQISTSTTKAAEASDNKYVCVMCDEKFAREKRLLTHIQSHYKKMDDEDSLRTTRKRKTNS